MKVEFAVSVLVLVLASCATGGNSVNGRGGNAEVNVKVSPNVDLSKEKTEVHEAPEANAAPKETNDTTDGTSDKE